MFTLVLPRGHLRAAHTPNKTALPEEPEQHHTRKPTGREKRQLLRTTPLRAGLSPVTKPGPAEAGPPKVAVVNHAIVPPLLCCRSSDTLCDKDRTVPVHTILGPPPPKCRVQSQITQRQQEHRKSQADIKPPSTLPQQSITVLHMPMLAAVTCQLRTHRFTTCHAQQHRSHK